MWNLSGTDMAILAVAGYVSLMSLVRLLRCRRDQVIARYQALVLAARKRKAAAERQRKRRESRRSAVKPQREEEQTESRAAA
ncbi:MAG: hypothetical protein ACODAD_07100 [Planctomycetota bacterium]